MPPFGAPRLLLQGQLATARSAVAEVVLAGHTVAVTRPRTTRSSSVAALGGARHRLRLRCRFRRRSGHLVGRGLGALLGRVSGLGLSLGLGFDPRGFFRAATFLRLFPALGFLAPDFLLGRFALQILAADTFCFELGLGRRGRCFARRSPGFVRLPRRGTRDVDLLAPGLDFDRRSATALASSQRADVAPAHGDLLLLRRSVAVLPTLDEAQKLRLLLVGDDVLVALMGKPRLLHQLQQVVGGQIYLLRQLPDGNVNHNGPQRLALPPTLRRPVPTSRRPALGPLGPQTLLQRKSPPRTFRPHPRTFRPHRRPLRPRTTVHAPS